MFKWITIAVAVLGLGVGIYTAATSHQKLPSPPPAEPPSVNPYPQGVAATGLVEAASRNVEVAAPEAGIIAEVFAQVNDTVKAGDPLFRLDSRIPEADLVRARAAATSARSELARLKAQPREEDVPLLEATVEQARATFEDRKDEYNRMSQAAQASATSANEVIRRRYAMQEAQARLRHAEADLHRLKSGAWDRDLAVAAAKVVEADAAIESLKLRMDRLTVRSPIHGTVLKRRVEPGEAAVSNPSEGAMALGDLTRLRVRAQVDEADAPLVRSGSPAMARVRGRIDAVLTLKMVRIEPLAQPKRQLAGAGSELVDTRVVEVLFEVVGLKDVAIYPGQYVDVFIDTSEERPPEGANK